MFLDIAIILLSKTENKRLNKKPFCCHAERFFAFVFILKMNLSLLDFEINSPACVDFSKVNPQTLFF